MHPQLHLFDYDPIEMACVQCETLGDYYCGGKLDDLKSETDDPKVDEELKDGHICVLDFDNITHCGIEVDCPGDVDYCCDYKDD